MFEVITTHQHYCREREKEGNDTQIDVLEVNTCKTTAMFPLQTLFSSETKT
jgi:hypothetical protein